MDDLNEAIDTVGMSIKLADVNSSYRAGWQSDLGIWLRELFKKTSLVDDLNKSLLRQLKFPVKNTSSRSSRSSRSAIRTRSFARGEIQADECTR